MIIYQKNCLQDRGYKVKLYFILPVLSFKKEKNFRKNLQKSFMMYFPSKILFTSDPESVKLEYCFFGFGLGFDLLIKEF